MKNKIFGLILLMFFAFSPMVSAQKLVDVSQMVNVSLKISNTQNHTVSAIASFTNNSDKNFAKSYLAARLISPNGTKNLTTSTGQQISIDEPGQLIGYAQSNFFPVLSGNVITQDISIEYPAGITSGTYKLVVELLDQEGGSQGATSQDISLSGTDTFLEISDQNCSIQVGDITYSPMEGPIIGENQRGILTCIIVNNTGKVISAKPQISYAINSITQDKSKVYMLNPDSKLTITPGQTGKVTVTIPENLTPQVYEGLFVVLSNTDERISPIIPFRWIVSGPSARINNLDLDKSFYKKGETAKVSISVLPSMDLSWRGGSASNPGYTENAGTDLKDPRIFLKVFNGDKQLCGQKETSLPPTKEKIYWEDITVSIPLERECENPLVEAEVYEEGIKEPLAVASQELVTKGIEGKSTSKYMVWIGIVIGVLMAIIMGYIFWKRRHASSLPPNQPIKPIGTAIFLLISIASMFFVKQVYGQVFIPLQGVSKPPVNSTDVNTKTATQKKYHDRKVGGPNPLQWANVRDFAENTTGGDSHVKVSADCRKIEVTVNGTASSDYMCSNWGPGIAIANFVDGVAATPSAISSALANKVIIPSLQIVPSAFNNSAAYGPHILNVYNVGTVEPKSVTYTLQLPNGLSDGVHTLLLQAGPSQTTTHGSIDRFYSTLEQITDGPGQFPDFNCEGKSPCYIPLKYTFTCGPPPACNSECSSDEYCKNASDGCIQCVPSTASGSAGMRCQPPPPTLTPTPVLTCSKSCVTSNDCTKGSDGCPSCLPNAAGVKVCQPAPACNAQCFSSEYCKGAPDGCTSCSGGTCKAPACNISCDTNFECAGAKDGCTVCKPDEAGKKVCQPKFSDKMCKCDGMDFSTAKGTTFFPGDDVTFIAFGKVEGQDIEVADITSMTFSLYQSTLANPNKATRIAQSTAITPEIAANSGDKIRYKVSWNQKIPSTVPSGSLYRVQATIKCAPKPGVLGAATTASATDYYADLVRTIQGIIRNTKTVLGEATQNNQQAKSFFPGAKISEKSCSIIKYYFD